MPVAVPFAHSAPRAPAAWQRCQLPLRMRAALTNGGERISQQNTLLATIIVAGRTTLRCTRCDSLARQACGAGRFCACVTAGRRARPCRCRPQNSGGVARHRHPRVWCGYYALRAPRPTPAHDTSREAARAGLPPSPRPAPPPTAAAPPTQLDRAEADQLRRRALPPPVVV